MLRALIEFYAPATLQVLGEPNGLSPAKGSSRKGAVGKGKVAAP
jgi:hypothetical protein